MTANELKDVQMLQRELKSKLDWLTKEVEEKTTAVIREMLEGKCVAREAMTEVIRVNRVIEVYLRDGYIVARVNGTILWQQKRFGQLVYKHKELCGAGDYYSLTFDPDFGFRDGYMHFIAQEVWNDLYESAQAIGRAMQDCFGSRLNGADRVVYIKDGKLAHGMVRGFNEETMALQILHDFDEEAGVIDERPGEEVYLV